MMGPNASTLSLRSSGPSLPTQCSIAATEPSISVFGYMMMMMMMMMMLSQSQACEDWSERDHE